MNKILDVILENIGFQKLKLSKIEVIELKFLLQKYAHKLLLTFENNVI